MKKTKSSVLTLGMCDRRRGGSGGAVTRCGWVGEKPQASKA
jgi:hypothetical protein